MIISTYCHSINQAELLRYELLNSHPNINIVDWISDNWNTTLKYHGGSPHTRRNISNDVSDLLSLGITSYVADDYISREGAVDGWCREINISLPTSNDGLLSQSQNILNYILSFVSGDIYNVLFRTVDLPLRHIVRDKTLKEYDAVSLFSGGIDSLSGVINLLESGAKLCLVGHFSDGLTHKIQQSLVDDLMALYPGRIDFRSVSVRRTYSDSSGRRYDIPEKVVRTHRVRSFLFLSLAAVFAELTETENIYMPENGIIGLNIPLEFNRIGALSTRTSHPHFLIEMSKLLSLLMRRQIRVINPFMLKSKIAVIQNVPASKRHLLEKTYSCAPGIRVKDERIVRDNIIHCGCCIPCIYRRLSMNSIGLDDPSKYKTNIFSDNIDGTDNRLMHLRALTKFVKRFNSASAEKKRAIMMSNGHIPVSRLNIINDKDTPFALQDFIDLYDEHAAQTLAALRSICSVKLKTILSI